jgi:hypothetical protein
VPDLDALVREWADEQLPLVEERLVRFGVSGMLVDAAADCERGSVVVTNGEGRSIVLAAPRGTVEEIADVVNCRPTRYHVSSSTADGSVAVLWAWGKSF